MLKLKLTKEELEQCILAINEIIDFCGSSGDEEWEGIPEEEWRQTYKKLKKKYYEKYDCEGNVL